VFELPVSLCVLLLLLFIYFNFLILTMSSYPKELHLYICFIIWFPVISFGVVCVIPRKAFAGISVCEILTLQHINVQFDIISFNIITSNLFVCTLLWTTFHRVSASPFLMTVSTTQRSRSQTSIQPRRKSVIPWAKAGKIKINTLQFIVQLPESTNFEQ
jgi:hypothetical protein